MCVVPFVAAQSEGLQSPSAGLADAADPALDGYLLANGLLNRGLYELAATEYRRFLKANGDHAKAPLARYGLAVCLSRLGKPADAAELLARLRRVRDFSFAAEVATLHGQALLALGSYSDAAEAFEEAVQRFPQHDLADDAAAGLVEARHRAGEHDAAGTACRLFVEHWPKSKMLDRVEFLGALSEMASGDAAGAAVRFARVSERQPDGPFAEQAHFYGARCAQQSGDLESAERGYRAILARKDSRFLPDALYGLATIASATNRQTEAGEFLDRLRTEFTDSPLAGAARFERARVYFAQEQLDRALPLFDEARGGGGETADDAAYWAAKCCLRRGEAADAAKRLAEASQLFPESNLVAEMAYDRAVALSRSDQPEEAAAVAGQFLRVHPRHTLAPDALCLLAVVEQQSGLHPESLAHCEAFLKAYPDHALAPAVRLLAADNEFAAGQYGAAAERYAAVLKDKLAPEVVRRVQMRRGLALFQIERFDAAAPLLIDVAGAAESDAAFRPVLLALGEIAFQRGDWPTAEAQLARYAALGGAAPAVDEALLKLGVARQRQARHPEALEAFDRLLSEFPNCAERGQVLFERGQTLAALNREADAAEALRAALEQRDAEPYRSHALYHLGVLARKSGDASAAAGHFAAVLRAEPDAALEADAAFERCLALLAIPQEEEAIRALTAFLDHYAGDRRAPEARARLALALGRTGRQADAAVALENLTAADTGALEAGLQSAVQYQRATAARQLGKSDEAAAALRGLAATDGPLRIHAALDLAEMEMAAKHHEAAATVLREARASVGADAKLSPELAEPLLYRLGVCAYELKRWDDAATALEELLTALPDTTLAASASFFAGEAHLQAGRPLRAAEHLARAVEKYGPAADAAPPMLRLGECTAGLQQWARSERAFSDYLARFSAEDAAYQARFGVGWARENLGRFDEAIEAYRAVVAQHQGPTAARAQFQIGECLFAKKKYDEAVRELLKVDILYAYPEWSAAALYEAGRCFEALNKTGEARQQFKQVVEKHGETRWARLAGERLARPAPDAPPGK